MVDIDATSGCLLLVTIMTRRRWCRYSPHINASLIPQYPAILPFRADLVNDLPYVKVCIAFSATRCRSVRAAGSQFMFASGAGHTLVYTFFPSLLSIFLSLLPTEMSSNMTFPGLSDGQIGPRAHRQRERELRLESVSPIHWLGSNPRRRQQTHESTDLPFGSMTDTNVRCSRRSSATI